MLQRLIIVLKPLGADVNALDNDKRTPAVLAEEMDVDGPKEMIENHFKTNWFYKYFSVIFLFY